MMDIVQVLSLLLGFGCGCFLPEICPPDWHRYGGSCYFIIKDKMDWYEANRTCAESRANLAVPNSPSEQDYIWEQFLREFDQTPDSSLWIGCNDIEEEGNWLHCPLKGKTNAFENWAVGEPTDLDGFADCARMCPKGDGQWDDVRCHADNTYAVCGRRVSRLTPQCLLHHAMEELMGNGDVSCGKSSRSHPRCHSFNLQEQDCPPM